LGVSVPGFASQVHSSTQPEIHAHAQGFEQARQVGLGQRRGRAAAEKDGRRREIGGSFVQFAFDPREPRGHEPGSTGREKKRAVRAFADAERNVDVEAGAHVSAPARAASLRRHFAREFADFPQDALGFRGIEARHGEADVHEHVVAICVSGK
jgi:hypothetical protein